MNKFNDWPGFTCPKLEYLNISSNRIDKVHAEWRGHPTLRTVISCDNRFKDLSHFKNMPNLQELYLGQNMINSLAGAEGGMPALKRLHLRRNRIATIPEELPEMPELVYLNLRSNLIETLAQAFGFLQFPNVIDLNIMNNPVDTKASSFNLLMAEFLIKRTTLERFCKKSVTERNKLEAVYLA